MLYGTKYSRMEQVKFAEDSLWKVWRDMDCLSSPYPFKFLKAVWHKFYLVHSWILLTHKFHFQLLSIDLTFFFLLLFLLRLLLWLVVGLIWHLWRLQTVTQIDNSEINCNPSNSTKQQRRSQDLRKQVR